MLTSETQNVERLAASSRGQVLLANAANDATPLDAFDIWQRLLRGEWSLNARFERDGRAYFIFAENEFGMSSRRALSRHELSAWLHAAAGSSNKLICYDMRLSPSAVVKCLSRARSKLGGKQQSSALQALLPVPVHALRRALL